MRRAFAAAMEADERARANDWLTKTTPEHWEFTMQADTSRKQYDWSGGIGAWPFDV
ncbi:MAG TPA: hypothetical protein VKT72_09590 [Candidatus Baltobacteraceae bacterium]|nr:hypothetical protein [Candidatus Baltobacteraceae bacterium]